jgi:hypothetical protein
LVGLVTTWYLGCSGYDSLLSSLIGDGARMSCESQMMASSAAVSSQRKRDLDPNERRGRGLRLPVVRGLVSGRAVASIATCRAPSRDRMDRRRAAELRAHTIAAAATIGRLTGEVCP